MITIVPNSRKPNVAVSSRIVPERERRRFLGPQTCRHRDRRDDRQVAAEESLPAPPLISHCRAVGAGFGLSLKP